MELYRPAFMPQNFKQTWNWKTFRRKLPPVISLQFHIIIIEEPIMVLYIVDIVVKEYPPDVLSKPKGKSLQK